MRIPDGELRVWLSEWLKFVEITGFSDSLGGSNMKSLNNWINIESRQRLHKTEKIEQVQLKGHLIQSIHVVAIHMIVMLFLICLCISRTGYSEISGNYIVEEG